MNTNKYSSVRLFFATLSLMVCAFPVFLQAQTLSGSVRDADNGSPIGGASVQLFRMQSESTPLGLASDPDGLFTFEGLKPGYYRCEISAVGYDTRSFGELLVAAGKDQRLEATLLKSNNTLPDVTISAVRFGARPVQPLGEVALTRDQTLRFPAMFFDPGRLAAVYPGAVQTDDGTNGLSIRGNNPSALRWRLFGADVVNPNHLPNAGTFSDRAVAAGGGVLMFSAQMMDNSALLTGNYSASMGDALGGVLDMNLRNGNKRQQEFTLQAGLIGFDVAAEGPFNPKKSNSPSYLANYRYSTVGLLGQLGVSFGDESINFQDISFNIHFPGKKGGGWNLFGMGGQSVNKFTHKADTTVIKLHKERFDIDFESRTGIAGLNGLSKLGDRTWLKTVLVLSAQENQRDANLVRGTNLENFNRQQDEITEMRLAGIVSLHHQVDANTRLQGGLSLNQINYTPQATNYIVGQRFELPFQSLSTLLAWGWVQADWRSNTNRWSAQAGMNYTQLSHNDSKAILPRFTLGYRLNARQQLVLGYTAESQMQAPGIYTTPTDFPGLDNRGLDFTRAQQTGLKYIWNNGKNLVLRAEVFYQQLYEVPSFAPGISSTPPDILFSVLNQSEWLRRPANLENVGSGRNAGLELSAERFLNNGWFWLANLTLLDSKFKVNDEVEWLDTRWNSRHIFNAVAGKEWSRLKGETRYKTFGVNARFVWTGGFLDRPIDLLASQQNFFQETRYVGYEGYSIEYPDYYRADLRVYWKRSLGNRRNSTFAMDFQNVTARKNVAYYYFEPLTGGVKAKYQLEFIPNISWKLEF